MDQRFPEQSPVTVETTIQTGRGPVDLSETRAVTFPAPSETAPRGGEDTAGHR